MTEAQIQTAGISHGWEWRLCRLHIDII